MIRTQALENWVRK